MSKTKSKSISIETKLDAISYAMQFGVRPAAKKYGVDPANIRRWKSKQEELEKSNRHRKRLGSGGRALTSAQHDEILFDWIIHESVVGTGAGVGHENTIGMLERRQERQSFHPTKSFFVGFISSHVRQIIQTYNIPLSNIYNFDETAIFLDHTDRTTIDFRGARDVPIRSFGFEKSRITAVFAANAVGSKLPPCILLKSKVADNIRCIDGLVHCSSPNAWMNGPKFIEYVRYTFAYHVRPLLLVFDSAPSHISREVKAFLHSEDILFVVIPGGLTSFVQPADVSWFKPLKSHLKAEIDAWKEMGQFIYTTGNRVKAPDVSVYGKWLKKAWSRITAENVIKSFQCCFLGSDQELSIAKNDELGPLFLMKLEESTRQTAGVDEAIDVDVVDDFVDEFDMLS
ncbi:hypothetical protein Ae201684_016937 [Aphanomyces euteiches]|uniref:DDE-1 domain-containing protein n=1 Tax=Aphanomyces euteiches TaxID=100861 RepID=A0A6G0WAY0_9STRA|nr:hypothetical protein Ae201684_016937 [Aphanomyces euteiches]